VKWYIFPPKFFAVPAQYENNVAQKFYSQEMTQLTSSGTIIPGYNMVSDWSSRAVKSYIFPPKLFPVPAQYENNVARKF
jgi:hypothetical protein